MTAPTTPQALPPGLIVCPGWRSEYTPEGYINGSYGPRGSGEEIVHACGGSSGGRRRNADPAVIREGFEMCSRCRRQKKKYDDEHGAQERREAEAKARYEGLIAAYVTDVGSIEGLTVREICERLDGLALRSDWSPYPRRGEPGYRDYWGESRPREVTLFNVLRALGGLPIKKEGRYS